MIIRKTNGCNRSWAGARAHATITSVLRSCQKQGHDFVEVVKRVLRQPTRLALDVTTGSSEIPIVPVAESP